jgi:hypothetical protein
MTKIERTLEFVADIHIICSWCRNIPIFSLYVVARGKTGKRPGDNDLAEQNSFITSSIRQLYGIAGNCSRNIYWKLELVNGYAVLSHKP